MDDKRKIKDIFNCVYATAEAEQQLYILPKWYNQVIDKRYNELIISDVTRMIRQRLFIELAVSKSINLLTNNPFCGDLYEGELLEALYKLDMFYLLAYLTELCNILSEASLENKIYDWLIEDERIEFDEVINLFKKKLKSHKTDV